MFPWLQFGSLLVTAIASISGTIIEPFEQTPSGKKLTVGAWLFIATIVIALGFSGYIAHQEYEESEKIQSQLTMSLENHRKTQKELKKIVEFINQINPNIKTKSYGVAQITGQRVIAPSRRDAERLSSQITTLQKDLKTLDLEKEIKNLDLQIEKFKK